MLIAIYSRKSKWTGKGESIENQIIMCREYLTYVLHISEEVQIREYKDEGFSGKDTKRPMFQQMLRDMEQEHFDYLVCYKLDRLGRNLLDLTTLIERLEKQQTSFISIKERFDTTTPMGKAMLYFSGVLAQMEREQIAERVRDNMILLARSGRWLGGTTPYGFRSVKVKEMEKNLKEQKKYGTIQPDTKNQKSKMKEGIELNRERSLDRKIITKNFSRLEAISSEQEIVTEIFQIFLQKRSLNQVMKELKNRNIRNRNENFFSVMGIRDILTNPVYCCCDVEAVRFFVELGCQVCIEEEEIDGSSGLMSYGKTNSKFYKNQSSDYKDWIVAKAAHKGLITGKEFIKVQKILEANKEKQQWKRNRNTQALCSGIVYCSCGQPMRPKYYSVFSKTEAEKKEKTYVYLCTGKEKSHGESCQQKNINGKWLDTYIWEIIIKKKRENMVKIIQTKKEMIFHNGTDHINIEQHSFLESKEDIYKKRDFLNTKINKIMIKNNQITIDFIP